jgi:hypothetical protein
LNRGSQFAPVKEEIAERRQIVNAAFLVTLFQILVETPQMTATEALLRAQEKGALSGPDDRTAAIRIAGPDRRARDRLPGPRRSPSAAAAPDAGAERGYKLEYDSPLTRAMKADQGVGLLRTIEALAPLAGRPDGDGRLQRRRDRPAWPRSTACPGKWIDPKEERDAMREGRQQALQQQQMVQAIPAISGAAKDIAQAQAATQTARF